MRSNLFDNRIYFRCECDLHIIRINWLVASFVDVFLRLNVDIIVLLKYFQRVRYNSCDEMHLDGIIILEVSYFFQMSGKFSENSMNASNFSCDASV